MLDMPLTSSLFSTPDYPLPKNGKQTDRARRKHITKQTRLTLSSVVSQGLEPEANGLEKPKQLLKCSPAAEPAPSTASALSPSLLPPSLSPSPHSPSFFPSIHYFPAFYLFLPKPSSLSLSVLLLHPL